MAEIQSVLKPKPWAIVLYGVPGIGKSSIGAYTEKPVYVIDDKEDGINTLRAAGQVPKDTAVMPAYSSWEELLDQLSYLATSDHDYKTLVMDTLGGAERMCHEHTITKDYQGNRGEKGFAGFQRGAEAALPYWREMLNKIDRLRSEKGMRFLAIAHTQVAKFKNPEAADYGRYMPSLHQYTWGVTDQWADAVLFANYHVEVEQDGKKTAKGKGGDKRFLNTQWSAAFTAKNRYGLEPAIDMGETGKEAWDNLVAAIKAGRKAE